MRISDWSSDVCSSDLQLGGTIRPFIGVDQVVQAFFGNEARDGEQEISVRDPQPLEYQRGIGIAGQVGGAVGDIGDAVRALRKALPQLRGERGGDGDDPVEIGRAPWRERVCQYV